RVAGAHRRKVRVAVLEALGGRGFVAGAQPVEQGVERVGAHASPVRPGRAVPAARPAPPCRPTPGPAPAGPAAAAGGTPHRPPPARRPPRATAPARAAGPPA